MGALRHRPPLPDLEAVLRDLYGNLTEDGGFLRCLEALNRPLRSHFAGVHHEDLIAGVSWVEAVGDAPPAELAALADEYGSRWSGQNLWLLRGLERILKYGFGDGDDSVSEAELFAMPYYQHYLRRLDVRHGLGLCIWQGVPGQVAVASFNRSAAEGPFGDDVARFMTALRPHLYNAYAIHRRTNMLADENRCLKASMDRAPIGIVVLDETGTILHANQVADARLSGGQGLSRTAGGHLALDNHVQHRRLLTALSDAGAGRLLNCSILVVKPGHPVADGLIVHLCVLPKQDGSAIRHRIVAFLCPMSGDCGERIAAILLQSALSLTAAEARVVLALHTSHDLTEVAQTLGVSVTTARTHLKHAFDKTGARKQSELMVLVERLVAVAPAGHAPRFQQAPS